MKTRQVILGFSISGLMLASFASAQSNPNGQLPVTSFDRPYLMLIRDPVVHDDLGLDARQRLALAELNDQLDGSLWAMRNKAAEHVSQTMDAATAKAQAKLAEVLTKTQSTRLNEIEMWTLGMKAFARDAVAEKLSLTADQREKIREVMTKTYEGITELSKKLQAGEPAAELEKQALELRVDEQKQILAALSRAQQQQWFGLLGKRIDVAKLGRVKLKAPELAGKDDWLNSDPLTLAQLKGKVVALHFFAFA